MFQLKTYISMVVIFGNLNSEMKKGIFINTTLWVSVVFIKLNLRVGSWYLLKLFRKTNCTFYKWSWKFFFLNVCSRCRDRFVSLIRVEFLVIVDHNRFFITIKTFFDTPFVVLRFSIPKCDCILPALYKLTHCSFSLLVLFFLDVGNKLCSRLI